MCLVSLLISLARNFFKECTFGGCFTRVEACYLLECRELDCLSEGMKAYCTKAGHQADDS
jgi:hypothetical protein